ncbi:hypothetical protein ACLI1A_12260 [Flavobacterium sp. RHBU_3]|uniref:hypothetical protein n=1 Tax=Flavobacterium sp. RHBU_3 TaxID=3391184 RepID=UPI00398500ED
MRKILFALMIISGIAGFAQERFIEVQVADTIMMKPVGIKYLVYVIEDENTVQDEYAYKANEQTRKQKEIVLKDYLSKKGYKPQPADENSAPFGAVLTRLEGFVVTLKNQAEADKFVDEVNKLGYAGAIKSGTLYGDEAAYDSALIKKLLDKALKRAEVIATVSGMKLGRQLSIKQGDEAGGIASIVRYSNARDKLGNGGIKSETLTVRYEVQ